ncbi:DNA alkylation repair protein [Curtobacterium sp. MCBD17_021]|uniref:DNA alkylation repair protein n=1 Tax=Curtobacterium sp. MCBD17_021 TaxID=2175665 RepID=UPI000DAA37D9|nr:DNA alkylation repair protein [Curtobacterium sp. MCBD17_021]PZE63622.1 DNA alkylation repair protein [Curtobacterium sp. MCBD17_021]
MGAMDELITPTVVDDLASIMRDHGRVDTTALLATAETLSGRKLRARVDTVRAGILATLPSSYRGTAALTDAIFEDSRLDGWMIWPLSEAVVRRALEDSNTVAFDDVHRVLAKLTTRLTGEFAIRDLLIADHQRSLAIIGEWAGSPNDHVRRLASEGTRPRLPWAKQVPALIAAPGVTRSILDQLVADPSEYVRRSVGNHLNDISRDHPGIATAIAADWTAKHGATSTVRRGLRTLIKRGDLNALALLGFSTTTLGLEPPALEADHVRVGETLPYTVTVQNLGDSDANVVIDVVLTSPTAAGGSTEKVFKLAKRLIPGRGTATVSGKRSFAPLSTRTIRAGRHSLMTQANGRRSAPTFFDVNA